MVVGGRGSAADAFQQFLALSFHDPTRPERLAGFVFLCGGPPMLVGAEFGFGQREDGFPPGSLGDGTVAAQQVGLGELEIKERLLLRLILRIDDLLRGVFVARAQTGAFAGLRIFAVERISATATAG